MTPTQEIKKLISKLRKEAKKGKDVSSLIEEAEIRLAEYEENDKWFSTTIKESILEDQINALLQGTTTTDGETSMTISVVDNIIHLTETYNGAEISQDAVFASIKKKMTLLRKLVKVPRTVEEIKTLIFHNANEITLSTTCELPRN